MSASMMTSTTREHPPGRLERLGYRARAALTVPVIRYVQRLRDRLPPASVERQAANAELNALTSRRSAYLAAARGDWESHGLHMAEGEWFRARQQRLMAGGLWT